MTAADDPKIVAEVRASCTRFLSLHPPVGVHEWLGRLAATAEPGSRPDVYGEGEAVQQTVSTGTYLGWRSTPPGPGRSRRRCRNCPEWG